MLVKAIYEFKRVLSESTLMLIVLRRTGLNRFSAYLNDLIL